MVVTLALLVVARATTAADVPSKKTSPLSMETPACTFEADTNRLFALGMIETGNEDSAVGSAGEVSRYQLSPQVWRNYSSCGDYANPVVAAEVARMHWAFLANYFRNRSGRAPTDFDMYVLWNTTYGYYERRSFAVSKISKTVGERAERFVNLVNRRDFHCPRHSTGQP